MIEKSVVDSSLQYNGVVVLGYENNKYFYFVTTTREIIDYANPAVVEELVSTDSTIKVYDVKYGKYRELEYGKISEVILISVPLFSSPVLGGLEGKISVDILERSKIFVDKFKILDRSLFTDEMDLNLSTQVNNFVIANAKSDNLFLSTIDEIDTHILIYDKGIAGFVYNNNKEVIDFLSTGLGIMLEFFEPEVKQKIKELIPNRSEALEFTRNCWRTLLEIYRAKSLELYDEAVKKVNENSTLEDFEKEYILTTTQNEKDRIQKLDHEPYLKLIDDPNSFVKYWPYTNINLESTDAIVTNLGGSTVEEKFGDERPSKTVIVSNDYFFKLINIIKKYIPEKQFSLEDSKGLFTESTLKHDLSMPESQKQKIRELKEALVEAKKRKLATVKENVLASLNKELNDVAEEEVKNEIKEIINLIEKTQEEIDRLSPNNSTVDILDFWPPALYPMPNELNPNQ